MLRQMIEAVTGKLTDEEIKSILDAADKDIKFNHISFKVRTPLYETLDIIISCSKVVRRTNQWIRMNQTSATSITRIA